MSSRVMATMQAVLTSAPRAVQKGRMAREVRLVTILIVVIAFAGCATIQRSVGGWFGAATPTPSPTPQTTPAAAQGPRVYYAGVEGLNVYSEPSASSKVVGQLSLHEKVTRTKLERGFAYVESAKRDLKGWVTNAQLIWRLPTTGTPAPAEAQPEAPVAPTGEEPQAPVAPEATAPAAEPLPTATPVPAAPPSSQATPRGVAPSIFNPY